MYEKYNTSCHKRENQSNIFVLKQPSYSIIQSVINHSISYLQSSITTTSNMRNEMKVQ